MAPPPKRTVEVVKTNAKKVSRRKPPMVDIKPLAEMTHEELEAHVGRLRQELERERQDRNRWQVERDKVATFWAIAKHQLEERTAELRTAQQATETLAERRERELTAYRLRVRQLEAAHASELAEARVEMVTAVGLASQEAKAKCRRPRVVEEAVRKEQADHDQLVRQMKLDHEKELHKLRQDFEQQSEAERKLYMEKMRQLEERLDVQRRVELQATEEMKNEQIHVLTENHEKKFMDIKNYYHSITANNINLVDTLKSQLEEMQKNENRVMKENSELTSRNRVLEADLCRCQKECTDLRRGMENHTRDVRALKIAKAQLKETKKCLSDAKLLNEALQQQLKHVEGERDELYNRFAEAVEEVKRNCGLKNALLERRMASLGEELEKARLLRLGQDGATEADALAEALTSKDCRIKDLNYELARVCKAYNDLLDVFKRQLESYGIRPDDMGFKVVESVLVNGGKLQLGKGPAGLVTGAHG